MSYNQPVVVTQVTKTHHPRPGYLVEVRVPRPAADGWVCTWLVGADGDLVPHRDGHTFPTLTAALDAARTAAETAAMTEGATRHA